MLVPSSLSILLILILILTKLNLNWFLVFLISRALSLDDISFIRLKKIFFCYSTALHPKQWSTSLWYFHTDCWLWLWWYTTSLPDWSIWNVPCMEGGAFFSLFLCFCSSPQEIINTLNLNWLDSWMKYDLKLRRKLTWLLNEIWSEAS